jgi:hypothetical protein
LNRGDRKEKECDRALEDPWGAVGVIIAQKRLGANTGALLDQTGGAKPEAEFPATTLQAQMTLCGKKVCAGQLQ